MKIAVFDVSHWHFPLYLSALRDPGVQVVGVSDTASFAGPKFADQLNCRLYESNEDLLNQDFDFALVFSRHSEMAGLAEQLIARGIPLLIEKPCGLNLEEVRRVRQLSETNGVYVSVPFIMRVSDLAARNVPTTLIQPGSEFRLDSLRFVHCKSQHRRQGRKPPMDLWTTQERALTTTPQAPH